MCPYRPECKMPDVLSKMHLLFVHLTENVRCRSMDVTVKNKKKKRKHDHFPMLINSKDRMMYALFSNGGVAFKHWLVWQSKVLLIFEDGGQMFL